MKIGKKIYYNSTTGEVIWDKGEMEGSVRETTFEEDCEVVPEIDSMDVDVINIPFGTSSEQFSTMAYSINPITKEIAFSQRTISDTVVITETIVDEKDQLIQSLQQENAELKEQLEAIMP